jgi:hypothetical protein
MKSARRKALIQGLALLQNAANWKQSKDIFQQFCVLTLTKRFSRAVQSIAYRFLMQEAESKVSAILRKSHQFQQLMNNETDVSYEQILADLGVEVENATRFLERENVLEEIEKSNEEITSSIDNPNLLGRSSITESSGFFIAFQKIFKKVKENIQNQESGLLDEDEDQELDEDDETSTADNPYFNPKFVIYILTIYCVVYPFWGSQFLLIHTKGAFARLTNGPVEQYNKSVKKYEFKNHLPISSVHFLDSHRRNLDITYQSWEYDLEILEKSGLFKKKGKGRPKKKKPYGVPDEENAATVQAKWRGQNPSLKPEIVKSQIQLSEVNRRQKEDFPPKVGESSASDACTITASNPDLLSSKRARVSFLDLAGDHNYHQTSDTPSVLIAIEEAGREIETPGHMARASAEAENDIAKISSMKG